MRSSTNIHARRNFPAPTKKESPPTFRLRFRIFRCAASGAPRPRFDPHINRQNCNEFSPDTKLYMSSEGDRPIAAASSKCSAILRHVGISMSSIVFSTIWWRASGLTSIAATLAFLMTTSAADAGAPGVQSKRQAMQSRSNVTASLPPSELLRSQPEPNCDWRASSAVTTGSIPPQTGVQPLPQRLQYERQCFRQYEIQARYRLSVLQEWVRERLQRRTFASNRGPRRNVASSRARRFSSAARSRRIEAARRARTARIVLAPARTQRSDVDRVMRTASRTSWTATFFFRN